MLNELAKRCYDNSLGHGFYDDCLDKEKASLDRKKINLDQKLMLMVGELNEAHDELRNGHHPNEIYIKDDRLFPSFREGLEAGCKPEGFPIELADCIIRILDTCGALGIDIQSALDMKMKYNASRPYKHGRKF